MNKHLSRILFALALSALPARAQLSFSELRDRVDWLTAQIQLTQAEVSELHAATSSLAGIAVPYTSWAPTLYPTGATLVSSAGILVSYAGSTYQLRALLNHSNYYHGAGGGLASAPWFDNTAYWVAFATKGTDGASGAPGADGAAGAAGAAGADGAGRLLYGPWLSTKPYDHDTNAWPVVYHDGAWWASLQSSSNQPPATNSAYWEMSVRPGRDGLDGADGIAIEFSGWMDRGVWQPDVSDYDTNHLVRHLGNVFICASNAPAAGDAPTTDADGVGTDGFYWDVLVARGAAGVDGVDGADGADGAQGPPGPDGSIVYVTRISYVDDPALNRVTNEPSATDDVPLFVETVDGTNYFRYGQLATGEPLWEAASNSVMQVGDTAWIGEGLSWAAGKLSAEGGGGAGGAGTVAIGVVPSNLVSGATNVIADSSNTLFYLEIDAPTWVDISSAVTATNLWSSFLLAIRGTNELTITASGGSVTGFPERVWMRTNRTVRTIWEKAPGETVWRCDEL